MGTSKSKTAGENLRREGRKRMASQVEKGEAFRALHQADETFIIPNPWDIGSAMLLQDLGFRALATTSAGFAKSIGKEDGEVTLEEKLEHCRLLSAATDVPLNVDFEHGFADAPEDAAANLVKVAEAGVVGASIEDYSRIEIYDFSLAVDRIAACAEAVSDLAFPFLLTARAENLLRGVDDLDDTIRRLLAFEAAGADVLYAPGLSDLDQVKTVIDAVTKPLNVLAPFLPDVTLDQYQELGVARVSVGAALAGHVTRAAATAGKKMMEEGSFNWR